MPKKERLKIVAAANLLLFDGDKVLLLRRFNTGYKDGMYSVPAGHLNGNETVKEAMSREIKEEIGLNILPEDLKVVHIIHRRIINNEEDDERFAFFLSPMKWSGEVRNMEPEKCDDLSWFSLNDLPENTLDYIKHAIHQTRNGNFYSELGWEDRR